MRRRTGVRVAAYLVLALLVASASVAVVAALWGSSSISEADPGRSTEPVWPLPASVPLPALSDVTGEWGLDRLAGGFDDPMAGGAAVVDVDRDGDLDLIVANGTVQIALWEGERFSELLELDVDDAMAVTAADVDSDNWPDLLVARASDTDLVIWGGGWVRDGGPPAQTELAGAAPSSGLLAAELSGDGRIDIVRLGRGRDRGAPDLLWVADRRDPRRFDARMLPGGDRLSLAAELADVDDDGLLDIWITRDVGWDVGGDSLLSRRGAATGPWFDVAGELGAALEVDGMGVTIADLGGDGSLDAYVSDLGDNEVLIRGDAGFEPDGATGAARIRPPAAPESLISSSWASGAADVNLDGRLDLVVVNGGFPEGGVRNKIPNSRVAVDDPPAILVGIGGGRFVDVWPRLALEWKVTGRGMTIADLDEDGDEDIVVVTIGGGVRALRNDSVGPTITVVPSPGCPAAGTVVEIGGSTGSFRRLLGAHTFAGAHGVGVVVGVTDPDLDVRVDWADGTRTTETVSVEGHRDRLVVDCERARP